MHKISLTHILWGIRKSLMLVTLGLVFFPTSSIANEKVYKCSVKHLYTDLGGELKELNDRPGNKAEFEVSAKSGKLKGYVDSKGWVIESHRVASGVYFVYSRKSFLQIETINTFHITKRRRDDKNYYFQFNRDATIYTGSCGLTVQVANNTGK